MAASLEHCNAIGPRYAEAKPTGLVLLVLAALWLGCQTPNPADPDTALALRDVTVIDGTGPPPPGQTVVFEGGRIAQIGPVGEGEIPARAEVLELSGGYVIPGFVDLHVHSPEDPSVHAAMLDRDPSLDVRNTRAIENVFLGGEPSH